MILTGAEIRRQVELGRIVLDPFRPEQCNPNSYNYRVGPDYIELHSDGRSIEGVMPADGLVLHPGRVYLCATYETIGSDDFVISLIGKSSMGRLGLFLQISADLGHQGEHHRWTLELTCLTPIRIYPEMVIGQVTFWMTKGDRVPSTGFYGHIDPPTRRRTTP